MLFALPPRIVLVLVSSSSVSFLANTCPPFVPVVAGLRAFDVGSKRPPDLGRDAAVSFPRERLEPLPDMRVDLRVGNGMAHDP